MRTAVHAAGVSALDWKFRSGMMQQLVPLQLPAGTSVDAAGAADQDYLRSPGAIPTTYGFGLVERVRALAPQGVDAALDLAGSGVLGDLVELTGSAERVVSIADFGAAAHGVRISGQEGDVPAALALAAWMSADGQLSIPVQQAFPLEQAAHAQAASQAGHVRGRLVIGVRPDH